MPKEQFSNDYLALYAAAEKELIPKGLKEGEKELIVLSRFPAVNGCWFSIAIIEKEDGQIYSSFKLWDKYFDLDRWRTGIFNLSRLRIVSETHHYSEAEKESLWDMISILSQTKLPENVDSKEGFVLDGCPSRLHIHLPNVVANYEWNLPSTEFELFAPFIDWMECFHDVNYCDKYLGGYLKLS